MEYPYSINDIKAETKVSLQSLYTLIKKNKEFVNENSTRKQRKVYYNQAVMDFFTSYYLSESAPETPQKAEEQAEKESSADALKAENDALKAQIDALQKQLEAKEAERLELLRQNGALILTLQQEKQEKMLLLPAPKKSFSDKVKSFFKGKPQE